MKYKIFELVQPEKLEHGDYSDCLNAVVQPYVLEELTGMPWDYEAEHDSFDSAKVEIDLHSKKLKHRTLTIIPIIEVK